MAYRAERAARLAAEAKVAELGAQWHAWQRTFTVPKFTLERGK